MISSTILTWDCFSDYWKYSQPGIYFLFFSFDWLFSLDWRFLPISVKKLFSNGFWKNYGKQWLVIWKKLLFYHHLPTRRTYWQYQLLNSKMLIGCYLEFVYLNYFAYSTLIALHLNINVADKQNIAFMFRGIRAAMKLLKCLIG